MASFLRGGYFGPPTFPPPGTTGISPTATPIDFNFTGGGGGGVGGGRKSHPDRQQQQAPGPRIAGGAVPIDTTGDPSQGGWADAARRAAAGITNAQQEANPLPGSAAATSNLGGLFGVGPSSNPLSPLFGGMGTPPAAATPATPATPPPPVTGGGPPMTYHPTTGQPFGTMRSYQTGTPFVPQTGPAMLHRGEQVVPAAQNPMNQQQSPLAGVGNRLPPGLIQALLRQMPQGGGMQQGRGGMQMNPQIMQALARLMQGGGGRM